ncbi:Secreted RxLR effector peptide protein [Phytophthora palmivora]|uniref:Secreted RxLR effector peptide protein n=1 Tax=Phytophthora palmivora TaxID=4796 RepID=A0A2P4XZH1_9STRA|nr:Secreted RxLR effector peptide protein [Phytophthora palmivora]
MRLYSVAFLVAVVLLANVEWTNSLKLTSTDYPTVIIRSRANHQIGVSPKRLLRRYDVNAEERAIGAGAISELTTKLQGTASKFAQKFVNMNKYEAQVATKLKLGHVEDVLTSSNLKRLTDQVQLLNSKNRVKKVSVIGTLTAKYGDDALTKALVAAQKKTTDLSTIRQIQALRKDQMNRWVEGGNSADDLARLLNIRKDKHKIFSNGKLKVLDDYVKLANRKNSDQTTLLNTLINGFRGEDKLMAAVMTAKMYPETIKKAKQLENSLIKKWAAEGQLPANVYQWLKHYGDVDYAFAVENFSKLSKYVDDFNVKNPSNQKSALDLYRNSFGDTPVAQKLVSAMNNKATARFAKELQTQQLKSWVNNKKSIGYALGTLKIDVMDSAAITRRKVDALEEFISLKGGQKDLIKTLTTWFGSKNDLALVLEKASTTAEATKWQKQQFAAFVNKDITPENFMSSVFKTIPVSPTNEQKAIVAKFEAYYGSLPKKLTE